MLLGCGGRRESNRLLSFFVQNSADVATYLWEPDVTHLSVNLYGIYIRRIEGVIGDFVKIKQALLLMWFYFCQSPKQVHVGIIVLVFFASGVWRLLLIHDWMEVVHLAFRMCEPRCWIWKFETYPVYCSDMLHRSCILRFWVSKLVSKHCSYFSIIFLSLSPLITNF